MGFMRIWAAPSEPTLLVFAPSFLAPRSFFSMARAPLASWDMPKRPRRVSLVISGADVQQNNGVAGVTPGQEGGADELHVVFEEEHGGNDMVAVFDVVEAFVQRGRVGCELVGGVDDEVEAGDFGQELGVGAGGGGREVAVHGDDDHAHGWVGPDRPAEEATIHSGPSLRRGFPR